MKGLLALLLLVPLAGCSDQEMDRQRSLRPYERSSIWPDGTEARPVPEGTVARGAAARATILSKPPTMSVALLKEGRRGYADFCAPCHGYAGDGDGIVVQRGFSPPPSYHSARLRAAPAEHFVDVITHGYGAMYSYADRVTPEERWAITAYIRALQLSRETDLASVPQAAKVLK